jgi:hypothetical protein
VLSAGLGAAIVSALLIGSLASPAWAAFSAPVRLSGPVVVGPNAVNDANGNAIAVWSQYDGARWRVVVRQISATGALGPVKTLSAAAQKPVYPQIAGDGDGGAIVVWSQFNGVTTRVKAGRISADGRVGAVKTLSGRRKTARPRVASVGKGNAIAVWSQGGPGASRIMARKIRSSGAVGRVKTLSGKRKKSNDPEIASDARGGAIVVWAQRARSHSHITSISGLIKARKISAKGRLGSEKTLSRRRHGSGGAQIASDARGNAVVAWLQLDADGRHGRIKARQISAKGAVGHVQTVTTANPDGPQIASDAHGDTTVVWSARGDHGGAQARQISAAGALGPVQTLSPSGGVTAPPEVGMDTPGNTTVVWSVYHPAGSSPVQARQVSAGGTLGPLQTISSAEGDDPRVAVNAEGDAFAIWRQFEGDSWRVWGSLGP